MSLVTNTYVYNHVNLISYDMTKPPKIIASVFFLSILCTLLERCFFLCMVLQFETGSGDIGWGPKSVAHLNFIFVVLNRLYPCPAEPGYTLPLQTV